VCVAGDGIQEFVQARQAFNHCAVSPIPLPLFLEQFIFSRLQLCQNNDYKLNIYFSDFNYTHPAKTCASSKFSQLIWESCGTLSYFTENSPFMIMASVIFFCFQGYQETSFISSILQ
jgi:hypothetical protein